MDDAEEVGGIRTDDDAANVIGLAADPSDDGSDASSSRPGAMIAGTFDDAEREVDCSGSDAIEGETTGGRWGSEDQSRARSFCRARFGGATQVMLGHCC